MEPKAMREKLITGLRAPSFLARQELRDSSIFLLTELGAD
jgi:hypothetical protein